ncbi:MAG: WYL domain-containing protein [Phycisphaeraceae bacterium]|nr:WYL domain-containing protein [Phycisphaeraceae bacterium]
MLAGDVIESEQLQLTMTQMLSLFLSQQFLLPLAGTQFGDGLQTAVQKIRALLPTRSLAYFEHLDESFFIKNLANHDYSGQDKEIRILNEALINQNVAKVKYRSASRSKEVISEFHPYGMMLLHASLYCIGYFACDDEVRTLKVARINGITLLGKTFQKPTDFSLANHCQGAFGVFSAKNKQKIQVAFTGWAATNVREIQWHPSQKIRKDIKDKVVATFDLGNTVEFKRWLLGFGQNAKVQNPKRFANEIREELNAAMNIYDPV